MGNGLFIQAGLREATHGMPRVKDPLPTFWCYICRGLRVGRHFNQKSGRQINTTCRSSKHPREVILFDFLIF